MNCSMNWTMKWNWWRQFERWMKSYREISIIFDFVPVQFRLIWIHNLVKFLFHVCLKVIRIFSYLYSAYYKSQVLLSSLHCVTFENGNKFWLTLFLISIATEKVWSFCQIFDSKHVDGCNDIFEVLMLARCFP